MRGTVTGVIDGSVASMSGADVEFAWFFRTECPAVIRTVYLMVHDTETARDIAQDAFIQLLTRWKKISRYERPDAWVRRVAIRMAVRAIRRERLRLRVESEVDHSSLPVPVDIDVLRAVRQLPAMQRAAVILFYFEDRSVSDVAAILNCSEVAAKVNLHRARKRLAELLHEEVMDVS
jgi:RNA polymerase sigma factor (sigma-70 family)